jgi:hypothetical protein
MIITVLDIVDRPVFTLKNHVSESALRLKRVKSSLRNVVFKNREDDG